MPQCDFCNKIISAAEMRTIGPTLVVAATSRGYLPKNLPSHYSGLDRETQIAAWQMCVQNNANTEWGICTACLSDVQSFPGSTSASLPQPISSQTDKQRTQDVAPAHGAPRPQQEAARTERAAQPQKATVTGTPTKEAPKEETVGGALKFLGFAAIMQPVAFGLAFLAFNMAKYNYQRLPNPIAFVMMVLTGAFAVLFAVAGPGLLISAIASCVKAATNRGDSNKKPQ